MLTADALRAFAIFAAHRSFTRAAAALRISQPALHVKIRKLADGLGVELYQRDGRGLALTPAGERLAQFGAESLRRVDDLRGELRAGGSEVRIAAGRAALRWVVSSSIRALHRSGRRVQVITADRHAALQHLREGSADLAVIAAEPPPAGLQSRTLGTYPQVLVLPARDPLSSRSTLRLSDLEGRALLVPPDGRPHRQALDRALSEAGVAWQVAAEVDGWDLMVHFAALGLGAAVINGCVQLPARLRAVPIRDLPAITYWAAWRPARHAALAGVLAALPG